MFEKRPQLTGVLFGFGITILLTLVFFFIATEEPLELQAYDARVRRFSTLRPDPAIVHIDIDDGSLERIGRWPWRRRNLADLVRALRELDARLILVDLLLSEREEAYSKNPALADSDIEKDIAVVGQSSEQDRVYGDLELADAIRSAGNVLMAVQLDLQPPGATDSLRALLLRRGFVAGRDSVERIIKAFRLEDTPRTRAIVEKARLRLQIRELLLKNYTLDKYQLAERLETPPREIEAVLAGEKRRVARERVAKLFEGGSVPDFAAVRQAILGRREDRRNADRRDVGDAYRRQLGLRELRETLDPLGADLAPRLHRAVDVVPLYFRFADAALDVASVNLTYDSDHAVRRVPVVARLAGGAIEHLGLAAAARALDLDLARMSMPDRYTLVIPRRADGAPVRIPMDGNGNFIIHWTRTGTRWRSGEDFPHIPAAKIWTLVDARRKIEENETRINYLLADVVAASKGTVTIVNEPGSTTAPTTLHADNPFREKVNAHLALERAIHRARLLRDQSPEELRRLHEEAAALAETIRQEQESAVANVERMCEELDEIPEAEIKADPGLAADAKRFRAAQRLIAEDIASLRAANEKLRETIERVKVRLSEKVRGKYIFLGFAATAQGDIVATPIDAATNGVMCHANVLNNLLQNRFMRRAARWQEITACLFLGALIGLITGTRGPKIALLSTLALIAAFGLFNALVLFSRYDLWFALVPIVVTMFLTWAFVTLFRQLTAERDKRMFKRQLSQYTSPAIAERIAESPEAARAFKAVQTRDITCYFSDLKGFTSITETENAKVVQHVLNVYLEHMSRVIWSYRGLINKFMGDGIMAFFNPSVDPLPDHPRIACDAAVAAFEELDRLKKEQRAGGDGVFQRLEMRIGIATGLCMNGDLGSELKADYTVIGDVVNLAARLEPANKVFGTRIMVSGDVRDAARDAYTFRYLAELQVKGKKQTVPVYEIVCRKDELTDEARAYIERFEAGVELYKQRKWDACIVQFMRLLARKPDDPGAGRYIDACQTLKRFPPGDDWNGALELTEK